MKICELNLRKILTDFIGLKNIFYLLGLAVSVYIAITVNTIRELNISPTPIDRVTCAPEQPLNRCDRRFWVS